LVLFSIFTLKKQAIIHPESERPDPIIKNQHQPTASINNPRSVSINEAGTLKI
jgi:hypothetical protein